MQKLASFSVNANTLVVELCAHLRHEVAWEMCFSLQLMFSVSVRTSVSEFALAIKHFEVFAQLGFFFRFVLLFENLTLVGVLEDSLLGSSGCFAIGVLFSLAEKEVMRLFTLCLLRIVFVISASGRCSWWSLWS